MFFSENMITNQQITNFWDNVANGYGENNMTNCHADKEMEIIQKIVKDDFNGVVPVIQCYGCADGTRDPMLILNMVKNHPTLFFNDISSSMLANAVNNPNIYQRCENIFTICEAVELIDTNIISYNFSKFLNGKNTCYIFGVYNIDFFRNALVLYKQNKEIIGERFKVFGMFYDGNEITTSDDFIPFDIDNLESFTSERWFEHSDFLGYTLVTDKNFISSYYLPSRLKDLLKNIFIDFNIECDIHDRHIVYTIKNSDKPTVLVTMINNVLGNISYNNQIQALRKIHDLNT